MPITHATPATGIDSGNGLISKDAWNADHVGTAGGGAPDPIFDKFGDPDTAFEFDTSSLSGLTSLSTTPDVMDADTTVPGVLFIKDNDSGVSVVGLYASQAVPFTAICHVLDATTKVDYNYVGMFAGEATPGKLRLIYTRQRARHLGMIAFANPTDGSPSEITTSVLEGVTYPHYLAIVAHSSSNVDFLFSWNGRVWTTVTSGHDPSATIASVGLALLAINSSYPESAAFDYLRIWDSALVFPGT